MTAQDIKNYKSQLSRGHLNTQPVLQEIGEDLLFNPDPDPRYLVELSIFLREFHEKIYKNKKDIYTAEMRELLVFICTKASYVAENANNKKKGQPFYREVQVLGHLLIDNSASFQMIIGLILMINPEIKF